MKRLLATIALLTVAVPSSAMPIEEIAEMAAIMTQHECAILSTGYARNVSHFLDLRAQVLPRDTLQSWRNFLDLYKQKGKDSPEANLYFSINNRMMSKDPECLRAFMALPK